MRNLAIPAFIRIGADALSEFNQLISQHNLVGNETLLVTNAYLRDKYQQQLSKLHITSEILLRSAQITEAQQLGTKVSSPYSSPLLIAFGGGKVIDVTKYISLVTGTNYICVPTALSHDGICSPVAVLSSGNSKERLRTPMPTGVIIDLDIVKQAPSEHIAAGVGDSLSNLSALKDWDIANASVGEPINGLSYGLSYLAVNALLGCDFADINAHSFLKCLAYSLVVSGIAMMLAGNSRPSSGAEHMFSHYLDGFSPERSRLHGVQVGFGTLITELLRGNDISPLIAIFRKVGLPVNFEEFGFDMQEVILAIQEAPKQRPERFTILNIIPLSQAYLAEKLAPLVRKPSSAPTKLPQGKKRFL